MVTMWIVPDAAHTAFLTVCTISKEETLGRRRRSYNLSLDPYSGQRKNAVDDEHRLIIPSRRQTVIAHTGLGID